jgi:hypothetical protein
MSERLVRLEELAVGIAPDLPDQKPILWEDSRGVLFKDRTIQPMPSQVPLVSAGVPVNSVASTGDLVFLGSNSSVLVYSLSETIITNATNPQDKSNGEWSLCPFGTWMLGCHGGKVWIWKPRDDNQYLDEKEQTKNPAYWPYSSFQEVTSFTARGYEAIQLIKIKNFVMAICKDSVLWASDDDPEDWTPEESNMAGDLFIRDIQGDLIGGASTENFAIICTNREAIRVDYISRPYIFSYKKLIEGAGIYNLRCITTINKSIFGFGANGIWVSDGSGFTFIDGETVGATIDEKLDTTQSNKCLVGAWNILQHVFFFVPTVDEGTLCFGFNLENSTWMTQDWDRVASWKQYWVDSVGTLYLDDLKSAENLQAGDGRLPLIESASSSFGFGHFGYGDQGYGGEIWYQV